MNVYIISKKQNIGNPKKHEYRLLQENELAYYLWCLHKVLYNTGITCFPLVWALGSPHYINMEGEVGMSA